MDKLVVVDPALVGLSGDQIAALFPYFLLIGTAILAMILGVLKILPSKWSVFAVEKAHHRDGEDR